MTQRVTDDQARDIVETIEDYRVVWSNEYNDDPRKVTVVDLAADLLDARKVIAAFEAWHDADATEEYYPLTQAAWAALREYREGNRG